MSLIRTVLYIVIIVFICDTRAYSQDPITINIGSDSGPKGSTRCIDFTTDDFTLATAAQFVIRFDPSVARLIEPLDLSTSCLNIDENNIFDSQFNLMETEDGFINVVWIDFATEGLTLDDDCDLFFTLCFELIGEPCDQTDICITESSKVSFEFVQIIDTLTGEDIELLPIINKGQLVVDPSNYVINTAFCSTDDSSNSGSITFSGAGGTGPYSWSISPGTASGTGLMDCETATVDNLGPGTYTVIITDSNNVVRTEVITITTNSDFPFTIDLDPINPTCFDSQNGSIIVSDIQGGEGPFSYEWSTFQFFKDTLENLGSGDYALTITDVNGCTTSAEVSLNADTISLSYVLVVEPSCEENANDGLVTITAEGGTPYPGNNYTWDIDGIIMGNDTTFYFGGTNFPLNPFSPGNLPEGCFEVVATDNASIPCASDPFKFCIESGAFANLDFQVTNIACFGGCEGAISITAPSINNFNFTVTDPDGNVFTEMNTSSYIDTDLCGGQYDVTIEDLDANCIRDTFFIIEEPALLEINVIDSIGPGCGGGDGMISMEALGGTADFTFLWNDGFDQASRVNMGGGNYSVTLTDANGCQDSISFTFADGGDIGLSAFVCQAISCGGLMDGSVCAGVSVAGSYTFSWADGNGIPLGTGVQIDGLGAGTYFVTATDGQCTDTDTVFLVPGPTPDVSIVQEDPTCLDSPDGRLTATLTDGVSPAMFEWTEPPSTMIISDGAVLTGSVGTYLLVVTDANGCTLDTMVTMTPPMDVIEIDVSNIVENICFGACEGEATFTASGGPAGTGEYVFFVSNLSSSIDPGGNTATVDVLCGGLNWVYAIDGVCASDTFFFTVPDAEPIALNEAASMLAPPSCAGGDDGSITIEVQGGNDSSYDIFWVNEGIGGPTLSNLESGIYIYNVTDGSNCVFTDTIVLAAPDSLKVEVDPNLTIGLDCANNANARIGLFTTGGNTGTLMYDWDPAVSTTDFAENLGPGTYSVTVTDSKGCSAETSYSITSADPVEVVVDVPEEPDCFGGQVCIGIDTVFGGVGGPYTFTIQNGPRFPVDTCINVFANELLISVFDPSGCAFDTTVTIGQPEQLLVDVGPDVTINLGESTDPISAFIVSELNIDSIFWNPITNLECNTLDCQVVTMSPLATTNYSVVVVDENGCTATDDITVTVDLAKNVFFSNIFSPNGDNQNDFFQLATGSGVAEVTYFRIYDRWGNKLHEELAYMPDDSLHPGWDGTRNNQPVETGVYVYFAEVLFLNNERVLFKGDVTLIR
ncbi:MAG: gliding motility-associated C-terminal domain-containing protein [Bacteroidota bacterium]